MRKALIALLLLFISGCTGIDIIKQKDFSVVSNKIFIEEIRYYEVGMISSVRTDNPSDVEREFSGAYMAAIKDGLESRGFVLADKLPDERDFFRVVVDMQYTGKILCTEIVKGIPWGLMAPIVKIKMDVRNASGEELFVIKYHPLAGSCSQTPSEAGREAAAETLKMFFKGLG